MLAAVSVMLVLAGAGAAPAAEAPKPNIVVILADDMAPYDISALVGIHPLGNSVIATPNLDSMVTGGHVFTRAYNMGGWSGAVCLPSRTMIMTGRSLWHIPGSLYPAPDQADKTLPMAFNNAGYDTMRTGKGGNVYKAANNKFDPNYDESNRNAIPGPTLNGDRAVGYIDTRIATSDIDPFLVYVGFGNPHDPRNATADLLDNYGATTAGGPPYPVDPDAPPLPPNYLPQHPFDNGDLTVRDEINVTGVLTYRDEGTIRNELGKEYAVIEHLDQEVGRILAKLLELEKDLGVGDGVTLSNTIVVFTSDQGIAVGSHGLMGKQNLYEHTIGAPMIVYGAVNGVPVAPGTSTASVYLMDLFPTLADMAGIPTFDSVEGQSFAAALRGEAFDGRETMYHAYTGNGAQQRAMRIGDYKMIHYSDSQRTQLFNIAADPAEMNDLSHDLAHFDTLMQLKGALGQAMVDLDDPGHLGHVGINVSYAKSATQSSTVRPAEDALDGAASTLSTFAQTGATAGVDPWWQVDLGDLFRIDYILLHNVDADDVALGAKPGWLRDIYVDILDETLAGVWTSALLNPNNGGAGYDTGPATLEVDLAMAPLTGRYVQVRRVGDSGATATESGYTLALDEVQVFAVPEGYEPPPPPPPPPPPAPGSITEWNALPTGPDVVLASAGTNANNAAVDRDWDGWTNDGGDRYRKSGMTIESPALNGDETGIVALTLELNVGSAIPDDGQTHEIDIWIGEWNTASNAPGATVRQEQFDASGITFTPGKFYTFTFQEAFTLDPATDYAFELWWTTDEDSHCIIFARTNSNDVFPGGMLWTSITDPADDTFPFSGAPTATQDVIFVMEAPPVLAWTGAAGAWSDVTWEARAGGPASPWPNTIIHAVVDNGGSVAVSGDRTARSLTVASGAVDVLAGGTLAVGGAVNVAADGALAVHGTLAVGTAGYATTSTVATPIEGGGTGVLSLGQDATFHADGGLRNFAAIHLDQAAHLTTGETNNLTQALTLGTDAVFDLTTGNLIVDYATPPVGAYSDEFLAVETLVKSGYKDGPLHYWDGPGIQSSAAAGSGDQSTTLATFDNAGPGGGKTNLEGEPVDATSVLVKYAWYGDINLDGVVDFNDYNIIDNTFLSGVTTGKHWQEGDLNYDGVVDFNDYNVMDNTWLAHAGQTLVCSTPSPTPEPATLALVALGGLGLLGRQRRKRGA